MKNVKINWDIMDSKLYVEMTFPFVSLRSKPPHKTGHPISSSIIVQKALKQTLEGTEIEWKNSSHHEYQTLYLTIGLDDKDKDSSLTLQQMNLKLALMHSLVTTEINKLINPRD